MDAAPEGTSMIMTMLEFIRFYEDPRFSLYTVILIYFWSQWIIKMALSRFYKPARASFNRSVSVIVPTYKEDWATLTKVIGLITSNPLVREIIIVTDVREPHVTTGIREHYKLHDWIKVIEAPIGKRWAVRKGIEAAAYDFIAIIESDTFADKNTIQELLRSFANSEVGGVVGDQQVHQPYKNLVHFWNYLVELIKYRITVPALSIRGEVTVLGGRCVMFRKEAVLPLIPALTSEQFLGKDCIAGDDGRLTTLILQAGWKSVYQSTAKTQTVSPPTWVQLLRQRLRWFRNGNRRSLRALTARKESGNRWWIYRRPFALAQMVMTWTNTGIFTVVVIMHIISAVTGDWRLEYYGLTAGGIVLILWVGTVMTRMFRIMPALEQTKVKWWASILAFPLYLAVLWMTRMYSIVTLNRQGWLTRLGGPGGFIR